MDLHLHIGTEKTGTTTVQSFLARNRVLLARNGVFVPRSLGSDNHRKLPVLAYDPDFTDEFLRHEGLVEPDLRHAALARWTAAFDAERTASKAQAAVISSEHLQSRLRSDSAVARLRDFLAPRFGRIRVVIYLRDPFATVLSGLSTAIKYGGTGDRVPGPANVYWHNLVNHRQTLERWGAVFGRDNLKVRLFDRAALEGGDLIADFIAACGLPDLDYQRPERLNESLSGLGMALMARVNRRVPVFLEDGTPNPARGDITGMFETHFTEGAAFCPADGMQARYREAFAASNHWVRCEFFPDRDRLFTPVVPPPATALPKPDELDRIAAMIADMWLRGG